MATFFEELLSSAREEIRVALRRPWLLVTGLLLPVFWMCVLVSVFDGGLMRSLPVGCVDQDCSVQSREYIRAFASSPSIELRHYETQQQAMDDLKASRLYALIHFPNDWSAKRTAGRSDAAIELYLSKTYYAIATTLEIDIKRAAAALDAQASQKTLAMGGIGSKIATRTYDSLGVVSVQAGNETFNFRPYLLATLMPGVFAITIVLTMIGVLVREHTEKRIRQWAAQYGSVHAGLLGKILPWFLFYALASLAYVAWFSGFEGHGASGSLLIWMLAALLLATAMIAYALFFVTLMPSWILGLSFAIGSTAPIFPYTGFSYPLESMSALAAAFGQCLPLTWFLKLQSMQWTLASALPESLLCVGILLLFTVVPGGVGLLLYRRRLKSWIQQEQVGISLPRPHQPVTLMGRLFEGVRFGATNHDSFMIFVLAVGFYLVFYAWPYANQTICHMPVAVVDLDQSEQSRSFIQRLKSASAVDVRMLTTNPQEAQANYRADRVSGIVTIPETFGSDLLSGKQSKISLISNGAYPVKGRAVEMALTYVSAQMTRETMARLLTGHGASAGVIKRIESTSVTVSDQQLFNTISGYSNYTVSVVAPLIVQAVIFIGLVMTLGMWLADERPSPFLMEVLSGPRGYFTLMTGFALFTFFWFLYTEGFDFWLSEYSTLENFFGSAVCMLLFSFTLVSFGLCGVLLLNSHYYGAQLCVPTTAPLLFISGVVYPESGFGFLARAVSQLIPSTPGVPAVVSASQNGASLVSLMPEVTHLFLLLVMYSVIGLFLARRRYQERAHG